MKMTMEDVLRKAYPVLPVLVIDDVARAVDLAKALYAGGIKVLEVTLRTPNALQALTQMRQQLPEMIIGAGTVIHAEQFQQSIDAGAQFAVSPGFSRGLVEEAAKHPDLPYLPAVMTPSEVLQALEYGYRSLKLFPANGGASVRMLNSFKGPFTGISFCPTGGITRDNLLSFLSLPNVVCCGGTWIAPASLVNAGAWDQITELAREACQLAGSLE
ncbi:2-dehydro-3-deoxyphosphogluconate aldolase [Thiopseudomonas alkaliphila]|uniref:2-dehydro-3-deoxy-phosphogluconate aldolase n=1 Tax=Thiopseudomonas alkaliphila TaxID=1697053 RepID=A0A0K1XGV4_9GAMM|nr:bifunctional 4-hydroxy-2-oxoglutarate aldolase/2-dehydro-3-deoxy-phosphogluconate aldolase [Thiopseudomonas alkaliphila]AKX43920.1 2-dehydro-3-deoxyphosphogluconate aldolase [Thiopseudomonas alkaliphila]AKX46197.1 2-dehydro-3-deoxyphosphogluconate aldolase [Thiopseudomonas alkaliphila]AKX49273.1 2-dehydro-3-deoxyphosphogluconate aldolase [Thiopseudomonas alkaliphila]AKX51967.1 2-dehydro-3-deoxyphosphogluconate aldolase [Thiopseudomonas alkaliphila]AKX52820.1 2-dehydro-3-deoxyphosphogluconat